MKLKKRIISALLAASLAASLVVTGAFAASFNPVVDTITSAQDGRIAQLITAIGSQNFSSPTAEKVESLISYFIHDSKYNAIGSDRTPWPYTNSQLWTSCTDGKYTISGINGSGCFAYAKFVMNVIYGKTGEFLKEGEAAGKVTAAGLETFLRTYAQAGEQIRLGNTHSVVFISCDAQGFYYLNTWSAYRVTLHYTTFQKFAAACNSSNTTDQLGLYNANTNLNDTSVAPGETGNDTGIVISPTNYPSGQMVKGKYCNLTGSITSGDNITSFVGTIYNASTGAAVQSKEDKPNSTYVNIGTSKINDLSFATLAEGSYYLVYQVTDAAGNQIVWSSDTFTITQAVSTLSIQPKDYPSGTFTPQSYDLTGTVTSNYTINSVAGFIDNENGDTLYTATILNIGSTTFNIMNSGIDNALKFGELEPGNYYLIYTASDESGNTVTWRSPVITVPGTTTTPTNPTTGITISATSYPTGNVKAGSYNLRGTVTSTGGKLTKVVGSILRANGTVVQTKEVTPNAATLSIAGSAINSSLSFGKLSAGYYRLVYTATNSSGETATWESPVFAVSSKTLFTDVTNSSSWYYDKVYTMADMGIINGIANGNGSYSFKPDNTITRAEAVTLIYRMYTANHGSVNTSGLSNPFTDVASGSWYHTAISWAYQNKVVNGTSATTFDPNGTLTREQFAVMMYNYATHLGYNTSGRVDLSTKFTDAGQVSSYAQTALSWANYAGLINGNGNGTVTPKGSATRSQCATVLYNLMKNNLA